MRRHAVVCAATLLAAVTLGAGPALAQGFSVYEHDACAMGRSGAGVASPCTGGSAVFFNPAGILQAGAKWNAAFGATLISPRGSFTDSITGDETFLVENDIPVPSLYLTRQLGPRLAAGIGVFAPYGLTTEWPSEGFEGRFLAWKSTVASIYIQPTVAFQLHPRIQIGVGIDAVHSSVELHQRADLSTQLTTTPGVTFGMLGIPTGTDFADATLNASGWGFGAHIGIIARPTDWLSVGARYMSGMTIDYEGDAEFEQIPTGITLPAGNPLGAPGGTPLDAVLAPSFQAGQKLGPQTATASLPMPAQLVVGVSIRVLPTVRFIADWQRTDWSAFGELPLELEQVGPDTLYEDYENTDGWRGAVEFTPTPRLALRGGLLTHDAAAPSYTVTPLLPEGSRIEGVLGAGYQINPHVRLDVAYQYIRQQDRRGRVIDTPTRGADVNTGVYAFTASLIGAGLTLSF